MPKNIAMIGSREISDAMVKEIQRVARKILDRGDTIVTGGAWGHNHAESAMVRGGCYKL